MDSGRSSVEHNGEAGRPLTLLILPAVSTNNPQALNESMSSVFSTEVIQAEEPRMTVHPVVS